MEKLQEELLLLKENADIGIGAKSYKNQKAYDKAKGKLDAAFVAISHYLHERNPETLVDTGEFSRFDGSKIMKCAGCGHIIDNGLFVYCPYCGKEIIREEPVKAPTDIQIQFLMNYANMSMADAVRLSWKEAGGIIDKIIDMWNEKKEDGVSYATCGTDGDCDDSYPWGSILVIRRKKHGTN